MLILTPIIDIKNKNKYKENLRYLYSAFIQLYSNNNEKNVDLKFKYHCINSDRLQCRDKYKVSDVKNTRRVNFQPEMFGESKSKSVENDTFFESICFN